MAAPSKICIRCLDTKYLSQFYKNAGMVDGRVNVCIACKLKVEIKRRNTPLEISVLLRQWAIRANNRIDNAQFPQHNSMYGR